MTPAVTTLRRLPFLLPLLAGAGGLLEPAFGQRTGQDDEELAKLAVEVQEKLRRGRVRTLDALLGMDAARLAKRETARALRAYLRTGPATELPAVAPLLRDLASLDPPDGVELCIERLEAIGAAGNAWRESAVFLVKRLLELQREDGRFVSEREGRQRPDDAATTARAVLALRTAEVLGLDVPAQAVDRARTFLERCQSQAGGIGGPGARPSGAATAATLAAWTWIASRAPDEGASEDLGERIGRAEAWLAEEWTVERNPHGRGENLDWLVDLERAEALLLLAPDAPTRRTKRRDAYLADYQLPDWGWNEGATMQDVLGPAGSLPSGAGGSAGSGPLRGPRGVGAIPRIEWDLEDTASATLALGGTTAPTAAELRYSLRRRFASARSLPPVERFGAFVRLLRPHAEWAIPELLGFLGHPELRVREYAVQCLRALTGEEFGFDPRRSPEHEASGAAQQAWRRWWMTDGRRRFGGG